MDRPSCETCPYWRKNVVDSFGECNRMPPFIVSHELFSVDSDDDWDLSSARALSTVERRNLFVIDATRRPLTKDSEYCGEHPDFPAWIEHRKAMVGKVRKDGPA